MFWSCKTLCKVPWVDRFYIMVLYWCLGGPVVILWQHAHLTCRSRCYTGFKSSLLPKESNVKSTRCETSMESFRPTVFRNWLGWAAVVCLVNGLFGWCVNPLLGEVRKSSVQGLQAGCTMNLEFLKRMLWKRIDTYIYILYWSFQPSYLLIHSVQNILNHTYIAYMLQFCFLGCHQAMDMPQLSMGSPHRGWHATLEPPKWHSSTPPNSRYWWYLSCRWGRKMSEMIYGTRMY